MDDTVATPAPGASDTVAVTLRLRREVWRAIKVEAARQDRSAADMIREAFENWARNIEKKESDA